MGSRLCQASFTIGETCESAHAGQSVIFHWILVLLLIRPPRVESSLPDCSNDEPSWRYRTFNEEGVFFQCALPSSNPKTIVNASSAYDNEVEWFQQHDDGTLLEVDFSGDTKVTKKGNALWFSQVNIQDSGTYICTIRKEHLCLRIILDVQAKKDANCSSYGESNKDVIVSTGDSLSCPTLSCSNVLLHRSPVTWYKGGRVVVKDKNRFSLLLENNQIIWHVIYERDSGIYTCDYTQFTNTSQQWLVRALISLRVIDRDTTKVPIILDPIDRQTQEVELGKPFQLKCKVAFGFERNLSAQVTWFKSSLGSAVEKLEQESIRLPTKVLEGAKYLHIAKLEKVTKDDLKETFVCFARNSVGNSSVLLKLVEKSIDKVVLIYILCITIALLLAMILGSCIVYSYWIEIVLLFRNYISLDETIGDSKEFDAFVSYAKPGTFQIENLMKENDYEEERFALELLPEMLENKYGFRLCLMERDIPPGGAYVEDIARIIKRSRRAIFVLSPRYINDTNLFELQTAIKCNLEDDSLKLIFIEYKHFEEPNSLPNVIKKALHVLPVVSWKEKYGRSPSSASKFWNTIRYHMPVKKGLVSKKTYFDVSHC
ncbi:interleukin-18 receptor accessory protein [Ambystoma mexicanum]|uniref:interleukin-18 receptor accessory protein n=1 Tax=Ambystoma mexicanum TaxID=8296 RepID=UPI0037E7BF06